MREESELPSNLANNLTSSSRLWVIFEGKIKDISSLKSWGV